MFDEFRRKREAKKAIEAADKEDRRLDTLEDLNNARMEAANRKREQIKRAADLDFVDRHLNRSELLEEIDKAKGEMWVIKDQLTEIIYTAQKEIGYLAKQPASPGRDAKILKLNTKWKNAYYALALVEQTLERIKEIPEEHEWRLIMRDLAKGYKTINAISTGSDWMTRISLWYQKTKFRIKNEVSAISRERYFVTPIDQLLADEGLANSAADLLVTAQNTDMQGLSKDAIEDAAKNGVYLSVQPNELVKATEDAEQQMAQSGQTAPVVLSNIDATNAEMEGANAAACLEYIRNH